MDLNTLWFGLLGVLLAGYAILDGFDLGVGIVHLGARDDRERRTLINAIGPLWDGNEVWLITFGGALFAAFPYAYATVFSAFYLPFILLLFALISRAVSIEFRGKRESPAWRRFFDYSFFGASTLATLLFGVAVGNAMIGIPMGSDAEYVGGFFNLLGPFPLLVGLFAVSLFAMHGSIYAYLKTTGDYHERIRRWVWRGFDAFLALYLATSIYAVFAIPPATRNFAEHPWVWIVVGLNVLAVANIPRAIYHDRPMRAFLTSCCTIAALVFLFGVALFPHVVASSLDERWSLTVYNAASSQKTLKIMAIIALIGMPFVLAYTTVIYWVFRGKVELGKFSY
jgi:cytochrome d ubiquinol oxidase subunit II